MCKLRYMKQGRMRACGCCRTFTLQRRLVEQRFRTDITDSRVTERHENKLVTIVFSASALRRITLFTHNLNVKCPS